jgi:membrane dipeptidase
MPTVLPVFDGHNDTLTKIIDLDPTGETFLTGNPACRLDLPRAKAGGFQGGIFAIFTDPPEGSAERDMGWGALTTPEGFTTKIRSEVPQDHCARFTDHCIAYLRGIEQRSQGEVRVVTGASDLEATWASGRLGIVLHIEGAEAIREDLYNLSDLYDQGLRSIGLTWSRPNRFGFGVPFGFPQTPDVGPGLSEAGKELVRACNAMGIVVDLAHLNSKGFSDVERVTQKPLVVSHSNVHALCRCTRNLMDWQLDAVKASGGVVGLNFEPAFLRPDGKKDAGATLAMLCDHLDYIVRRIGPDHVGLGSDFDGADVPTGLEDAACLPNLWTELSARGYDLATMEKFAHGNWLRVLKATLPE